jgi:hypothetical protein
MNMPGFSAEDALHKPVGIFNNGRATRGSAMGGREVIAQLKGSVFHRPRVGGIFGTIEDYWTCQQGCESAHSECLAGCEGTLDAPKPSRNCILCDDSYNACMQGCSRDIA